MLIGVQRVALLIVAIYVLALPANSSFAQEPTASPKAKLALLLVADQMTQDNLMRFEKLYTGGLGRLISKGFVFTQAVHEHANTETAVGHATIATGNLPSTHGIVGNAWYDRESSKSMYCIGDSASTIIGYPDKPGRSPNNLKTDALAGWINRTIPGSKVYSISMKDRAAVLMAGYSADGVYWYNSDDGTFVTSLFYSAVYPQWISEFNETHPADEYFNGTWEKLLPDSEYKLSGPDRVTAENDGKDIVFPHVFSPGPDDDPKDYYSNLVATPYADHLVLRLARQLVAAEGLGLDDTVDYLMISCSAGDYVGHAYGPRSQEVQDQYLRLDRYLGEFFTYLDSTIGSDSYFVAVSSDHGTLDLPENLKRDGVDAGRIDPDTLEAAIHAAGKAVAERMQLKNNVVRKIYEGIYLDLSEADERGISKFRLQDELATEIKKIPMIMDVYTSDELAASGGAPREYLQLYRNSYYAGRSPDLYYRVKENYLITKWKTGTTHGSCYLYDRHVPIVFYGPGIAAQRSEYPAHTIDIAPTIADLIGLTNRGNMDGTSLLEQIRPK